MVLQARYHVVALIVLVASLASCGKDGSTQPKQQTPARITLSVSEATLVAVGQTLQLSATVLDSEGLTIQGAVVTWTSSNPSVVSVDFSGLATSLINGYVQITAASGGVTAVASIIVMQAPARVEVTPSSLTLSAPSETTRLYYTVFDGNGAPIPGAGVIWSSNDESVATISATGLVTAVGRGSTRITASSGGVSGSMELTVEPDQ